MLRAAVLNVIRECSNVSLEDTVSSSTRKVLLYWPMGKKYSLDRCVCHGNEVSNAIITGMRKYTICGVYDYWGLSTTFDYQSQFM